MAEAMSAREAEVLEALGHHLTNAEIGQRLHISVRTVESHVSSLLRKLGASDRRDLAAMAAEIPTPAPGAPLGIVGLPATWTTFVGRTGELEVLTDAIGHGRLVTLVGPGGVGKTRLALAAAGRARATFSAGGAFVDLVPVSPEFVTEAVAAALGVVERAGVPLDAAVHERLRAGRVLLVLDNCEHVLGAAATFARSVLASCPDAVVLATSRERLGVSGEVVVPLGPLLLTAAGSDGSDAERLFMDRAGGAPDAAGDPALVAEICRRLEGMPLAIELAAARSGSLGLDGLLAGLDDHLRLLSRSAAAGDRHGSLRTVITWSHALLDDDERRMFRRLGVFAGAFDLASAAAVAGGSAGDPGAVGGVVAGGDGDGDLAAISDVVGRLADKSLLVHGRSALGSRWRMLDTVRAYARERLEADGEEAGVRRRYLDWAARTARALEQALDDGGDWQIRFDACADDLRAALRSAASGGGDGTAYALALALGHLTYARRFLVEARDHLGAAVDRAPDEVSAVAALRVAAGAAFAEMRGEAAYDLFQAAFERASAAGDRRSAAIVLAEAAAIAGRGPALFVRSLTRDELLALADRARALAPPDDLEVETYLAVATAWDGACGPTVPDRARADAALDLARRLGDPVLISSALDAASSAVAYEGALKEASRLTAERLTLLDRLPRHDPRVGGEVADIFHMATESALAAGDLGTALASARRSHGDPTTQGLPHFPAAHLVIPLVLQGSFDEATAQADVMRDGWERAGRPAAGWMAPAFFASALVRGLRGDSQAYARWWDLATAVSMTRGSHSFSAFAAARVALHLGEVDAAWAAVTDSRDIAAGAYDAYARAIRVEVAVVAGDPDAEARLAGAAHLAEENDFVAALLLRCAGRLHGDPAALGASVTAWEAIGARFERASTLVLVPAWAAEGTRELTALGCPVPSS